MADTHKRREIVSFMLRFVREAEEELLLTPATAEQATPASNQAQSWRGVVKHIQSGTEHHFTTLDEAESFIKKFIENQA